jgi:hypothetical protein
MSAKRRPSAGALRALATMCAISTLPLSSQVAAHDGALTVELTTEVPPRCGFVGGSLSGQGSTPDLDQSARFDIRIKLDCNTPFAFGVVADRGKLTNLDASPDGSSYAFAKPYRVSVALDTDRGTIRSDRCVSTDLVSGGQCSFAADAPGAGLSSRRGISINRDAVLTVEWADQSTAGNRLAAGRYRDTLTLVVGPRA